MTEEDKKYYERIAKQITTIPNEAWSTRKLSREEMLEMYSGWELCGYEEDEDEEEIYEYFLFGVSTGINSIDKHEVPEKVKKMDFKEKASYFARGAAKALSDFLTYEGPYETKEEAEANWG
jgi:hypothetical protein